MSGDRDAIFGRIREALRVPAPRHHENVAAVAGAASKPEFREWLPQVDDAFEKRQSAFQRLSKTLKTEFVPCASIVAAAKHVNELAQKNDWKRLATHAGELNEKILKRLPETLEIMSVEPGYDRDALEAADAGLTECECLVAQTGSVCVTSTSSGGRTLSVLPPHHIVVARRSQLVTDLTAAYAFLATKYPAGYPSFMTFITGPSRTGDIERILVLGAHGPKKLTVLLVP
ncbi:MAG: LUD domain-containing protein [Chthoniobacteraceae bacterium]